MRLATAIAAATAVVAGVLALATAASAASQVRAAPGQVMFTGDNSPHRLRVIDSADLTEHDWKLDDGAPPDYVSDTRAAAPAWGGLADSAAAVVDDPAPDDQLFDRAEGVFDGAIAMVPLTVLDGYFERAKAIAKQLRDVHLQQDALRKMIAEVNQRINALSRGVAGEDSIADLRLLYAKLTARLNSTFDVSKTLYEQLSAVKRDISVYARSLSPELASKVFAELRRLLVFASGSEGGFITLGMLEFIGNVTLFADGAGSLASMLSDDAVVVVDDGGSPIEAHWPCRQVVRTGSGVRVPNAVSCPAPTFPAAFGAIHGFKPLTGLYVRSGDGSDEIRIELTAQRNPFSEIFVEGRGGDDTIIGSALGERLIGGAGSDRIFGRAGNDVIYGDQITTNSGVDVANANDRLYGEQGSDVIRGQLGNDMVSGGSGDDWKWVGAALSGGDGNDTVVGGPGRDEMAGNAGRDAVFAKESDFTVSATSGQRQADEADYLVDCGSGPGPQYFTATIDDADAAPTAATFSCDAAPRSIPTRKALVTTVVSGGIWPWFG